VAEAFPSDEELMRGVARGERDALRILVERHGAFVHRVAARALGNAEEARDAAQDVFVSVFRAAATYRPEARLTTWLYRITVNRCLDEMESRTTRRRLLHAAAAGGDPLPATHGGPSGAVDADPPDRQVERRERLEAVRAAFEALPPRQRMAVVLHRFEGLGYASIAEAMGCSAASVESLLSRAKARLAQGVGER
jgi:RNA polymerase sigma-70 factor (ECF subfamily)